MHKHGTFFKLFLFLYLLVLVYHAIELNFNSCIAVIVLMSGIVLAIFAHMKHGYRTIILLVIHMCMEWFEYAHSGSTYTKKEILFYGLHTGMDITFLWQEAKTHLPRFRYHVMIFVIIGLAIVFLVAHNTDTTKTHSSHYLFEIVVIGGILGCTLSHLFTPKKKCT